jgi:hypothetical protein
LDADHCRRPAPGDAKTPASDAAQVSSEVRRLISFGEAKPSTILLGVRADDHVVVRFVAMTGSLALWCEGALGRNLITVFIGVNYFAKKFLPYFCRRSRRNLSPLATRVFARRAHYYAPQRLV